MIKVLQRVVLLCGLAPGLLACATARPAPVAASAKPGNRSGELRVDAANEHLRLSVLAPGVVHVLFTRTPNTRVPASFAVDSAAQQASAPYTVEERADELVVRTELLGVRIRKQPLRVALLD